MARRRSTPYVFSTLEVPRRAEIVARRISEAIHVGDVEVGEKLPSEAVLSEQLGVSRSVLRDALSIMMELGLIRIEAGAAGGAFVIASPTQWVPSGLRLSEVDLSDMADVLIARRVIEPPIVELAACEATDRDFAALDAALAPARALGRIPKTHAGEAAIDCLVLTAARFNVALGRATHNTTMAEMMDLLSRAMEPVRQVAVRQAPREALSTLEHTLSAVSTRDLVMIRQSIAIRLDHLEATWERLASRKLKDMRRQVNAAPPGL